MDPLHGSIGPALEPEASLIPSSTAQTHAPLAPTPTITSFEFAAATAPAEHETEIQEKPVQSGQQRSPGRREKGRKKPQVPEVPILPNTASASAVAPLFKAVEESQTIEDVDQGSRKTDDPKEKRRRMNKEAARRSRQGKRKRETISALVESMETEVAPLVEENCRHAIDRLQWHQNLADDEQIEIVFSVAARKKIKVSAAVTKIREDPGSTDLTREPG